MGASRFLAHACKHNGLNTYRMRRMGLFGLLFVGVVLSATALPRWETGYLLPLTSVLYSQVQALWLTGFLYAGFALPLVKLLLRVSCSKASLNPSLNKGFTLPFTQTVSLRFNELKTEAGSIVLGVFQKGVFQNHTVKEAWM